MIAKKELYLFDFCDTLVDFQTANAFVNYVILHKGLNNNYIDYLRKGLNRLKITPYLDRLHPKMSINKALLLYRIKGYTYDELNEIAKEFYTECIKPHLIKSTLNHLINANKNGHTVAIISGGYDIYLKYFAEEYAVPIVMCSSLKFIDNCFLGKIDGRDCMGDEKPRRIYAAFQTKRLDEVFSSVVGYSDSESDIPFLNLCDKRYIITPEKKLPEWAKAIDASCLEKSKERIVDSCRI